EPSAVKVARWVLRGTTLGNRCRLLDTSVLRSANCESSGHFFVILVINDLTWVWETRLVECPVWLEQISASGLLHLLCTASQ
ncbi:hypothetical protein L9W98_16825, partial [Vibrio aestuarianus]|nr:hypothetical protein [Vibrio aestuarianus]MDE1298152.1 hypothetical protein [Vibrio aestuarianus]